MSDLISRQDAIDEAEEWIETYSSGRGGQRERDAIKQVISGIKKLPSAQPEIIRCKDCKWSDWYDSTDGNRYCYCMETGAAGRTADDFCSYAERRTDERFNQQTGGD